MTNEANEKESLHLETELLPAFDIISVIQEALRRARARYSADPQTPHGNHGPTDAEQLIELIGEDEVRRLIQDVIPPEPSRDWELRVFAYVEELAERFLEQMDTPKLELLRLAMQEGATPEPPQQTWNMAQALVATARRTGSRDDRDQLEEQAADWVHTRHSPSQQNGLALRYRDGSMAFQPNDQQPPMDITNTKSAIKAAMLMARQHQVSRAAAHAAGINEAAWGYRLSYYTPQCGHPDPDQLHFQEHLEAARQAADATLPEWELYGEKAEVLRFEDQSLLAIMELGGLTPDCWEITDTLALQEALEDMKMAGPPPRETEEGE